MKRLLVTGLLLALCASATVALKANNSIAKENDKVSSIYDFKLKDIDGREVNLGDYRGKVVMIVNVASKCGYTPQYEGLQALYTKYKDQGFVILGFPANNFGGQEPGTDQEIKTFCTSKYNVTFPMFSKISVKGDDQHALYKYLTGKETNPQYGGDIAWNFNKFLVNRKGEVVARFSSKDTPQSDAVKQAIEKYLKEK